MLANDARDLLIQKHLPLVIDLAKKAYSRSSGCMACTDFQEYFSIGAEAFLESATRYDSRRGCSFTSFAYHRVRGAMLDHQRNNAKRPWEVELVDEAAGLSPELGAAILDPSSDPEQRAQQTETRQIILNAIRSLPERQQKVIFLHFFFGASLREASRKLSLSTTQTWTTLNLALGSLREKLSASFVQ